MSETGDLNPGAVSEDAYIRLLSDELYANLKELARTQRGRLAGNETLQTTALVSEAYIKLSRQSAWKSREHFLNTAAMAMRQVLVDSARRQIATKRGGTDTDASIDEVEILLGETSLQVINIDIALKHLERVDRQLAKIVEYRFFGGYGDDEIAQLMSVSERTVQRHWLKARAWLYEALEAPSESSE